MDSSIFRRSLDIHQQTTQTHLAVRKGDTARKIVAALSDGGRPYRIEEGCYAVFKGKKPDGNVLYNNCTIENNCIVYEFTEQTAASAGHMPCEFQLYGPDGKIITSPKFSLIVSGLVYDDSEVESSGEFTALEKAMADVAELKATGLRGDEGPMGPQGPMGPTGKPFRVTVFPPGIVEEPYEDLQQEYEAGRELVCRLETEDQQYLELPLVETKGQPYVFRFNAVSGGVEWTAEISRGDDGAAVVAVAQTAYVSVQPAATDEKYFGITDDGMIYLLPAYRGAIFQYDDEYRELYEYAESDNGAGFVGTKYADLPEEIIIPEIVNEIPVTSYARAMFCKNLRVKRLTLLEAVKTIPAEFCSDCYNLEEVAGTEKVETIGMMAFAYSGIVKANFPSLKQLDASGYQFSYCWNLLIADLGSEITEIPAGCFMCCEKLTAIRNAEEVTKVGTYGLYFNKRLMSPAFVGNLKNIGDGGMLLSRPAYDWNSLPFEEGGEGKRSTAKYLNATDFWSGCATTPCNTRMRSTFEQHDPRWVDKKIGVTDRTWSTGCLYVSAAMVYSALMGVDMTSPEEFVEIVRAANPELMDEASDDLASINDFYGTLGKWLEAVGLTVECPGVYTAESLQTMYNALVNGALVITRVLGDSVGTNHAVVVHGVNTKGELLITDPASSSTQVGIYEAGEYIMPVQNIVRGGADYFVIVTKQGGVKHG